MSSVFRGYETSSGGQVILVYVTVHVCMRVGACV